MQSKGSDPLRTPLNNPLWPRWFGWLSLTGARELSVKFGPPITIDPSRVRDRFHKFLRSAARADEWATSGITLDELANRVSRAKDICEIFKMIEEADPGEPGIGGLNKDKGSEPNGTYLTPNPLM